MSGVLGDLRHAVQIYRATPVASGIAVLALAVAMAFVSAFLAMWSDLSLKPPAGFERGGGLVTIGQSGGYAAADTSTPLTAELVEGINGSVSSLEFAAGIASFPQMLRRDDTDRTVTAEAVTRHYAELRPRIALGRQFDTQDHLPDAEPVVILSNRFWQAEFGGREDVLGETVRITEPDFGTDLPDGAIPEGFEIPEPRGQDYRIVGVMSRQLTGTFTKTTDIWLAYEQAVPFLFGAEGEGPQFALGTGNAIGGVAGGGSVPTRMRGLGRLADGVSTEAAGNELNARFEIEGQAFAQGINLTGEEIRFDVLEGVIGDIGVQRESRRQVRLFLIGTLLLVLVAACNISLFLLSRASRRQRELGIRMAVGASTRRLARQLASEAGLLVLASAAIGLLISLWLSVALRDLPFLAQAEWLAVSPFDWRALAMLGALMLLLTLLVSLAPIVGLRRMGIRASSAMMTARAGWAQRLVGAAQIALTGVVGAVALAFAWHFVFYASADRGFDPEDVLVVELDPATTRQPMMAPERHRQHDIVVGLPGVLNSSFASYVPGGAGIARYTIVQRESGRYLEFGQVFTDENYLDVLGITLLHGTNIHSDEPGPFLGNESYALGTYGRSNVAGEVTPSGLVVRGVVKDVVFEHPSEAVKQMGINAAQLAFFPLLLVKTAASPAEMRGLLQERIDAGELELGIANIERLKDVANRVLLPDRARMTLTVVSALLVMILAAFGFYGTQRYLVTAGQREYAIRSAIGAGPQALGRLVLSRGLVLALPGLVAGGLLAFIAVVWLRDGFVTRAVSTLIVTGWVLLAIVALVLAATWGPAMQARRTAPAVLLREA
jgi:ABC-type antimicrobial peptide transport system permease subunit